MMFGFLMMQPPWREHSVGRTDTSRMVAAVPFVIVVLLTVLQVMIFTPYGARLEAVAQQGPIGLVAP